MKMTKEIKRFSVYDGCCLHDRISIRRLKGCDWECKWTVTCGERVVSEETFTGRKTVLGVLRASR